MRPWPTTIGSPLLMMRLDGLHRPRGAREPELMLTCTDCMEPSRAMLRQASNSLMPGLTPRMKRRSAFDVLLAAYSKQAI